MRRLVLSSRAMKTAAIIAAATVQNATLMPNARATQSSWDDSLQNLITQADLDVLDALYNID